MDLNLNLIDRQMRMMLKILFSVVVLFLFNISSSRAQSYPETITKYQAQYVKDLLAEPRHPIIPSDTRFIHFYNADPAYCVMASFTETHGSKPFLVPTHSGKQKPFREYGVLTFSVHDTSLVLHVYQIVNLIDEHGNNDELFIPFNDLTNYDATFAGGRYIDLSKKDIVNGRIQLDFNKCYNPYCAYAEGFSCPIPPQENYLPIAILAGEKMFSKHIAE